MLWGIYLSKALKVIIAVAVMLIMVLSVVPSTAQAGTNGNTMKFLAKGTLYDGYGEVRASDVWFTFSISSVDPHTLTLGNNSNDVHYLNLRTFGSGGTIDNMSGPDEWVEESWFVGVMSITALFEYGVSKTSVILKAPGGGLVLSPNPTTPAPGSSSHSFIPINPVLAIAFVLIASFALIGSIFLLDRRMQSPPT
jgi:hypothetical protein